MKLLKTENALNSQLLFYLPKGSYSGFVLYYNTVANTGVTLTKENFGQVILNANGQDVINSDVEFFNLLSNIYGGYSHFQAASGGATKLFAYIPCSLPSDKNVLSVNDSDRILFNLNFSYLSSHISSGTVSVYGIVADGLQNYYYNFIQRPIVVSGASTLADSYLIENVTQIFVKGSSGLLDRLQYSKDSEVIIEANKEELNYYSDFIHNLESDIDFIAIDLLQSMDYREILAKSISYNHSFSSAGTLKQYFSFLTFDNNKTLDSYYKTKQRFETKMNEVSISKPIVKSADLKNVVD